MKHFFTVLKEAEMSIGIANGSGLGAIMLFVLGVTTLFLWT